MPDDADANIVKVVIHEIGDIPLGVGQRMTFIAATLGVEEFPAAFGIVVDRVRVTRDEMIEWRIERHQRTFVGGEGAQQIGTVDRTAEDVEKCPLVFLNTGKISRHALHRGLAHLHRINDRQCRLVLKVSGAAIPKLCLVVERVQDGGGVPLADSTLDANRDR